MTIDMKKGRYWDEGITLVDGCTPCSPGCDHCWSAALAHRFYREGEPGHESGLFTDDFGRFNGDIMIHPERLKWFITRKPRVFAIWNDLFHEDVPDDFILKTIQLMGSKFHNIYLILTNDAKWCDGCNMAHRCHPMIQDEKDENAYHKLCTLTVIKERLIKPKEIM